MLDLMMDWDKRDEFDLDADPRSVDEMFQPLKQSQRDRAWKYTNKQKPWIYPTLRRFINEYMKKQEKGLALRDLDPMPFGQFKDRPMQDVPASYLHWLWTNRPIRGKMGDLVENYIENTMEALKKEAPDLIWK